MLSNFPLLHFAHLLSVLLLDPLRLFFLSLLLACLKMLLSSSLRRWTVLLVLTSLFLLEDVTLLLSHLLVFLFSNHRLLTLLLVVVLLAWLPSSNHNSNPILQLLETTFVPLLNLTLPLRCPSTSMTPTVYVSPICNSLWRTKSILGLSTFGIDFHLLMPPPPVLFLSLKLRYTILHNLLPRLRQSTGLLTINLSLIWLLYAEHKTTVI